MQGKTRSPGFFYQFEGQLEGLLGLPIIGSGRGAGHRLRHESAALLYLRSEALSLSELARRDPGLRPRPTAAGLWG